MIATAALHDALELRVQVDAMQNVENLPGEIPIFRACLEPLTERCNVIYIVI